MNSKRTIVLGTLVLGVTLGWIFGQPVDAQQQPPQNTSRGQFQMELNTNRGGTSTTVFVMDTRSGHCWYRETAAGINEWTDMGIPGAK